MKISKKSLTYVYAGLALLATGLVLWLYFMSSSSVHDDRPDQPAYNQEASHAELIASLNYSDETLTRIEDCSALTRLTNQTARLLCLLREVRQTWPFTDLACGLRDFRRIDDDDDGQSRIFASPNHAAAGPGEYPWYINMRYEKKVLLPWPIYEYEHMCGGSLITWTRGLSAAHCCLLVANVSIEYTKLHFGRYLTHELHKQNDQEEHHRDLTRPLADCVMHPDYRWDWTGLTTTSEDIAILKWDTPVSMTFSRNLGYILVNTVCLPPEPFVREQVYDSWQELPGYGRYQPYKFSDHLRRVPFWIAELVRLDDGDGTLTDCTAYLEGLLNKTRPKRIFYTHCPTAENPSRPCFGDSGGPMTRVGLPGMVSYEGATSRSFQVGIAVAVYNDGFGRSGCGNTVGAGFVRVAGFKDWILQKLN